MPVRHFSSRFVQALSAGAQLIAPALLLTYAVAVAPSLLLDMREPLTAQTAMTLFFVALTVLALSQGAVRRVAAATGLASGDATLGMLRVLAPAVIYTGLELAARATGLLPARAAEQAVAATAASLLGAVVMLAAIPATAAVLRSLRARRRGILVGLTAGAVIAVPMGTALAASTPAAAATPPNPTSCNASSAVRTYDVAAINVHVPFNRWGMSNENGMAYVLQGDKQAMRDWHKPLGTTSSNRRLRPRPLVIRANEGECVQVTFTNELNNSQGEGLPQNPRASMAIRGVPYDVQRDSGTAVGYNDDSTVSNNAGANTTTYYWRAPAGENTYFFSDGANLAGSEADGGTLGHGLYGALVVEPAGSTWRDRRTNKLLYTETKDQSGELYLEATITQPNGYSFREAVYLAQDEMAPYSIFGFNYGSEPDTGRHEEKCNDCIGEETSLSSWTYGDPALVKLASGLGPWKPHSADGEENCGLGTDGFDEDSCFTSNVVHTYANDPTKIRYGMAGVKETHVFHLHANQWLAEDKDTGGATFDPATGLTGKPQSQTIDSQTFGPMEMFTADLLYGAGSKEGTIGDAIFHCHLYPHFAAGFWALLRTHDVLEDGTNSTPDGILVSNVTPLPKLKAPPAATAELPGYPRFIPGKFGHRAPQPPMGITEFGQPGMRFVDGKPLDDNSPEVKLEVAAMKALSGNRSKPGAPFRDPCPTGSREVNYKVSLIQTDIVYNERGDHDTQGRILVMDDEVDDVLAGRKNPEPLFFRVNAGDCVNFALTVRTPNWYGNDAYVKLQQTNMFGQHIHLVKFDVMASDGSSNGWNYQEAAFTREQADFNKSLATNPEKCTETKCTIPTPDEWDPTTKSSDATIGQTIHERWYADYELRTVFTHDHHFAAAQQARGHYGAMVVEPAGMDFRNPATGQYYAPINDAAHGTVCGTSCEGKAAGARMDVIGQGADDDFREFDLAVADFVSLTKKGGNPQVANDVINPPSHGPEAMPDEDPGTMAINYRNAPLDNRVMKNGQPVDPAYAFSSTVWGDPMTPVLQAYSSDNVRVRAIQGSQEEQHTMTVHGIKWQREPDDPESPFVNSQSIGISEAFNFEVPMVSCATGEDCRGDYLYTTGSIDDISNGMWGVLRVHGGKVPGLLPLPDNPITKTGVLPQKSATAVTVPAAPAAPATACKTGAVTRNYDVVAMQAKITYNKAGDHDPFGLIYALASEEAAIKAGKNPEPLVLRANEGECISVKLTNKLTTAFLKHTGTDDGDAPTPGERKAKRTPGLRVSMHAGLLKYDVRTSDGATVGFNKDQTTAPGASRTYVWYADEVTMGTKDGGGELGALNLSDYGDVRGHRHHGLWAGLVIEPKGSTWHDPRTGRPLASGGIADIRIPGKPDFREQVLFFSDGLNLRAADGSRIEDPIDPAHVDPAGEVVDPNAAAGDVEDIGEKAFGYRNAPFRHRLGYEPMVTENMQGDDLANVFSSKVHGDPETPMLRAFAGDQVRYRILQGGDKPRQHAFSLLGHQFRTQFNDPGSRVVGTLSGFSVGLAMNAEMGVANTPGDYLYTDEVAAGNRSGGLWGFMRVYPQALANALIPTAIPAVDDPRKGGHPILPLDVDLVAASAFNDLDKDGVKDANEPFLAGVGIAAVTGTGTTAKTIASDKSVADGSAYLSLTKGTYTVKVTPPTGYVLGKAPATVTMPGTGATVKVLIAMRKK